MIELRDVHVTLSSMAGPVKILRGVDLDVPPAASVSVVGPSGSGKSTLLAVIGGIERPTWAASASTARISAPWTRISSPRFAASRSAFCSRRSI